MIQINNNLVNQQIEQTDKTDKTDQTIAEIITGPKSESESLSNVKDNLYPLEIKYNNLKYNLLGYVYNTAYSQYYLLYETKNKQINTNLILREILDNLDINFIEMFNIK